MMMLCQPAERKGDTSVKRERLGRKFVALQTKTFVFHLFKPSDNTSLIELSLMFAIEFFSIFAISKCLINLHSTVEADIPCLVTILARASALCETQVAWLPKLIADTQTIPTYLKNNLDV